MRWSGSTCRCTSSPAPASDRRGRSPSSRGPSRREVFQGKTDTLRKYLERLEGRIRSDRNRPWHRRVLAALAAPVGEREVSFGSRFSRAHALQPGVPDAAERSRAVPPVLSVFARRDGAALRRPPHRDPASDPCGLRSYAPADSLGRGRARGRRRRTEGGVLQYRGLALERRPIVARFRGRGGSRSTRRGAECAPSRSGPKTSIPSTGTKDEGRRLENAWGPETTPPLRWELPMRGRD